MLIYLRIKTVPVLLKSNACLPHTKEVKSIFENKSSNSLPLSMILATKNSMLRESRRERAYVCVSHFSATDPLLFCSGFHDLKWHFESHHPKLHTRTHTYIGCTSQHHSAEGQQRNGFDISKNHRSLIRLSVGTSSY